LSEQVLTRIEFGVLTTVYINITHSLVDFGAIEQAGFSEALLPTWHHIPEDLNLTIKL
jgi:hypothetical protein